MTDSITVIEKPEWLSWDSIHNTIWQAHLRNRDNGIVMRYPSLSGMEIQDMIEGKGRLFVALNKDDELVGTGAIIERYYDLWCGKGEYAYFCFAAVLPEYGGLGIYKKICERIESECRENGQSRILFDTHENNTHMADISLKNGYKRVAYKNYGDHYNDVYVKWLFKCPFSNTRCYMEYFKSKVSVILSKHIKHLFHKCTYFINEN